MIELLSPAGDLERLKIALLYGADAVYIGGQDYSLRANAKNFSLEDMSEAVLYAHSMQKKVYVTVNIVPHNKDLKGLEDYLKKLDNIGVDAIIVSDISIMLLHKRLGLKMELHISTQASIYNYETVKFYQSLGAKRVVLARELSLEEIAEIRAKTDPDLDIEVFVHGAMCVSFSGRCLLSQYLVGRDANRGECAQPCRWGYHLMEEKRPGEYFPIFEDENGTYILNAKDMCMIEHIDKLAEAGVTSLKIEGRAKSAYYVAVVTNAYRMAVDEYYKNPDNFILPDWIKDEVYKVSHRKYSNGFFFGRPQESQYYENSGYIRNYDVVAVVEDCRDGRVYCTQRNRFFAGDTVELLAPLSKPVTLKLDTLYNENDESIETANHAMMKFSFPCDITFPKGTVIRKDLREN